MQGHIRDIVNVNIINIKNKKYLLSSSLDKTFRLWKLQLN